MNTITFESKPRLHWNSFIWECTIGYTVFFTYHSETGIGNTPEQAYDAMVRGLGFNVCGEAVETQFRLQFGYYDNLKPTSIPANQAGLDRLPRC